MVDVAVLISGRGSNLQALIDACADDKFPARIVKVISNKANAFGLERARLAGIPTAVIEQKDYPDKQAFEDALDQELDACKVQMICLAGFMRLLDARFVNRWKNRILNIHPSLLPAFKGLHTHERALEAGVRFTGCTVHIVRPEMDDGPIILQAALAVKPDETPDELAARILELEHVIYPEALRLMASGEARIAGDRVVIESAAYPDGGWVCPVPKGDLEQT